MRNTQQDLLHELDALDIPEAPLTAGEMDRLTRAVMGRVEASHAPEAESSHEAEKIPAVHVVRHRALTFGIAAAVVCALCGTAAAVGAHSLNRVRSLDQEAPRSRPV